MRGEIPENEYFGVFFPLLHTHRRLWNVIAEFLI